MQLSRKLGDPSVLLDVIPVSFVLEAECPWNSLLVESAGPLKLLFLLEGVSKLKGISLTEALDSD